MPPKQRDEMRVHLETEEQWLVGWWADFSSRIQIGPERQRNQLRLLTDANHYKLGHSISGLCDVELVR